MKISAVVGVICSVTLVACAQQPQAIWLKPGAGQNEFSQDKYACMQQSQQPASSAYVGQYGGFANSNIITNGNLYNACMNSHGWSLTPVSNVKGYNDEINAVVGEQREACVRADLQAIFSKKMTCKPNEAAQEQLSDRSKISSDEKIALLKWQDILAETNGKIAAIHRQYNPKSGEAIAVLIEKGVGESKNLALELYNGRISWGDYNKRRNALFIRNQDAMKTALAN